jgi:hypothetical protein
MVVPGARIAPRVHLSLVYLSLRDDRSLGYELERLSLSLIECIAVTPTNHYFRLNWP